jgi:hypothetical protein
MDPGGHVHMWRPCHNCASNSQHAFHREAGAQSFGALGKSQGPMRIQQNIPYLPYLGKCALVMSAYIKEITFRSSL